MILLHQKNFFFNTKVFQKISTENVDAELILRKSTEIMKNLEILLSFYNDNSDVSRINKNAGKDFVKVSEDTFEIVKKSIYYSKLTNGLFDITIAPLVKMWGVCSHNPKVISQENIDKILPIVDYNDILLDENKLKIMLNKKINKLT
ncbi:FAD:protein FMN transferase [Terrisporobacter vanillatitrophus]|uniref:FAD:protein FMN transferase n=1 Tax=Terrisporobacter vanillatitrophus TaxID=3058402 RepID=UPI003367B556